MPSLPMPTENTETQYSIDKELYDGAIAIRDEMNLYSERLNKMDEHKGEVSEAVYLRVKSDYLAKLDLVKKSFEEKKQEIQKALLSLYDKKREQEAELQKHKDVLEEAKFRNFLGEITDKKFKETDTRESAEVKRLEKILATIQSNTKQYEDLVGGPVPEHEPPPPPPEPKPALKETPAAAPQVARLATAEEAPTTKPVNEGSAKAPPPEPEAEEESIDYLLEEEEDEPDYFQSEPAPSKPAPAKEPPPSSLAETGKFKIPSSVPAEKPAAEKVRPIKSAAGYEDSATGKYASAPAEKKPEAPTAKAAQAKGGAGMSFDDSISSILRSIPLDEGEEEAAGEAPVPVEEEESASPLGEAEEILAAMEEEEEGPSITQLEEKATGARIICVEGDMDPREVTLTENISIGRSPSNDIVLKEAKVSRQHAAINFIRGNYVIVDLKSSNGVFVNGQKIEEHVLQSEDEINIGSFRMVYRTS